MHINHLIKRLSNLVNILLIISIFIFVIKIVKRIPLNRLIDDSLASSTTIGFCAWRTVPNRLANSSAKLGSVSFDVCNRK